MSLKSEVQDALAQMELAKAQIRGDGYTLVYFRAGKGDGVTILGYPVDGLNPLTSTEQGVKTSYETWTWIVPFQTNFSELEIPTGSKLQINDVMFSIQQVTWNAWESKAELTLLRWIKS